MQFIRLHLTDRSKPCSSAGKILLPHFLAWYVQDVMRRAVIDPWANLAVLTSCPRRKQLSSLWKWPASCQIFCWPDIWPAGFCNLLNTAAMHASADLDILHTHVEKQHVQCLLKVLVSQLRQLLMFHGCSRRKSLGYRIFWFQNHWEHALRDAEICCDVPFLPTSGHLDYPCPASKEIHLRFLHLVAMIASRAVHKHKWKT